MIDRVYLHFVFKGDVDAAEKSEGLSNRSEDLGNKAHLLAQFFGERRVELQVDFVADKPGHKGPPASQSYPIHLRESGETTHEGRTMRVGFVPLMELYRIYKSLGQQFFDRNIRATLPPDNAPNKKLREALDRIVLKEIEAPSVFVFRHNGVTLAAERVSVSDGEATLHVPRLLNGAQTVSSVAKFISEHENDALLKKNKDRLEAICVLAKIVEDDPGSDFVTQVTISNNQQNPVAPWALRAMDNRQVDLADAFREQLGIFYSRQEGAFANLSDEEKEESGIEDSRDVRIRPLAQTFLAVQGEVHNMSNMPEVFESQKLYEGTFRSAYVNSDLRGVVLSYKTGLMMNRVLVRLGEALPRKYGGALSRARNLSWALLTQALLNDKKRETYLDDFGRSLAKEVAFGEILKQLTTTRLLPILKEVLASPTYQSKVAEDRFDFLRTSEAFKKAMVVAGDKFGWTKKSF
ncbi:MAG: AIPR family protein [Deltaproteobacteria bacterium]|nr:AIPR family protein [Deltaproteobacteria bacterium]